MQQKLSIFADDLLDKKQEEGITLKFARFCEGRPNGGALGEGRLGDDGQLLDGGGGGWETSLTNAAVDAQGTYVLIFNNLSG